MRRALRDINRKAADTWEDAEIDALAHLCFPEPYRVKIRTNNACERLNAELKRRARVVQAFPSAERALRLLGAVCEQQDQDRQTTRRFMGMGSLKPMPEDGRRAEDLSRIGCDEDLERSARVIIAGALDNLDRSEMPMAA